MDIQNPHRRAHLDPRVPHVFQNWSPENRFTNWDRSDLELQSDLGLTRPGIDQTSKRTGIDQTP
jgi:hypothetical protein